MSTRFYVMKNERVMGVADYPDDAMEYAERIGGYGTSTAPVTWSPNGYMLLISSGEPTDWKIMRDVGGPAE